MREQRASISGVLSSAAALGWRPGAIIDIGIAMGTKGLYDLWDIPILLVDPAPENCVYMEQIREKHPKAQIWNVAASDQTGVAECSYSPSTAYVSFEIKKTKPGWEARSFPTMTCDEIVRQAKVEPPFLFKLDTDSHEREILLGAEGTLKASDLCIIECKIFNGRKNRFSPRDVMDFMHARGFALYDIAGSAFNDKDRTILRAVDLVFAPENGTLFDLAFSRAPKAASVFSERRPAQREIAKQTNDFI